MEEDELAEQMNIKKRQEILRSFFVESGVHDAKKLMNLLGVSESTYFKTLREMTDLLYSENLMDLQLQSTSEALRDRVKYDPYYQTQNFLGRLYQSETMRETQIVRYALILKALDQGGNKSISELVEEIAGYSLSEKDAELSILVDKQVSRCVNDLLKEGMIKKQNRKGDKQTKYEYSLRSFFDQFNQDELLDLYAFIQFFTYAEIPAAPGFLLLEKLQKHLLEREGVVHEKLNHTIYQYPYCGRVLDEYMCYELLPAIEEGRQIDMSYSSVKDKRKKVVQSADDIEEDFHQIIPIKIVFDYHFARWYLIGKPINLLENEPLYRYRIDYITNISLSKKVPKQTLSNLQKQCEEELSESWCVTYSPLNLIKIFFHFDQSNARENFIKKKVEEQGQWGKITKEYDNGSFIWEISVRGYSEITPWIRSFGKSAIVIEPLELREKMIQDWKAVLSSYETCEQI